MGGGGERASEQDCGACDRKERAFQGGDPVLVCGRSFGSAHCDVVRECEFGDPDVRTLRGLFHDGRGTGAGCHVRGGRIRRPCARERVQPFCLGGKAVPFSAGVWESAAVFGDMDGDRLRCGDPIFRELSGRGAAACEDHGGDDRKDRGHGFS